MSVGLLADELVRRGHEVTVFGSGDSKTLARVISVKDTPWNGDYSEVIEFRNIAGAFSRKHSFEVIHTHVEQKAVYFAEARQDVPCLMSLRYGEFFPDERALIAAHADRSWATNSHALARLFPEITMQGVVHNGIDISRYPLCAGGEYLLFLSRLSPQKGVDVAIRVAQASGLPLILAGKQSPDDQDFLREKVLPYIDGERIRYVGEVGFEEKVALLGGARALLHPNTYFEACSNSILEAQAVGTPVIAYDNGSNRELVVQGVTGQVVATEGEMIDAVSNVGTYARTDCRNHVATHFTVERMADGYEALYKKMLHSA